MATQALHDRLVELDAQCEAARAEVAQVTAGLDAMRARVEDRQRSLAALAKLDLPPRSIVAQLGMAVPLFNTGVQLARDGALVMALLAGAMVLLPVAGAIVSFRRERRLLAHTSATPRPDRTRVAEELMIEDDAPSSQAGARKNVR